MKLFDKGESVKTIKVYGGRSKYVIAKTDMDIYIPVKEEESSYIRTEVFVPSVVFSPVKEGDILGNYAVFYDGNIIAKFPVISDRTVERKNIIETIKNTFYNIVK
ncbi:MAG: hypothetical protein N2594_08630 [Clostridiales bacterium]|nr:hypothetical protein [Clostridiales bacterium]